MVGMDDVAPDAEELSNKVDEIQEEHSPDVGARYLNIDVSFEVPVPKQVDSLDFSGVEVGAEGYKRTLAKRYAKEAFKERFGMELGMRSKVIAERARSTGPEPEYEVWTVNVVSQQSNC